ncbi:glycosyltransferase [Sulfuracidifex tepidarius]|uniref:Glycosyltransferase 2-like domain-containing protein n=1 Tax=Sulfuracidifex tepidarius TaxID=1294262 RepID=A0A510E6L8_9CREN|nr:glycosyltransferase family 2 protein [Sulfuracidifex tepidarius]BBG27678.1 hypothetical protein IC007_2232 [Sulfuracidifex tepidarius]
MKPKISILVVHFNSMKEQQIVEEHLKALRSLDYPNYEVIALDNGSTDSTYKFLKEKVTDSRFKLLRSDINTFFGGGNNIAFKAASKESKYLYLVNPDAVPNPDSANILTELMESDPKLGAIQGKFITGKGKIDTGRFIADDGNVIRLHTANMDPNKESLVTYVSGAMMMLRGEFSRSRGFIFYEVPFLYFDSSVLGMELYHHGYKVKYFPYETGYHKGKATTEDEVSDLHIKISRFLFIMITNSKFRKYIKEYFIANYLKEGIRKAMGKKLASPSNYLKAFRMAMKYNKELNIHLDIYRIPHAESCYKTFFMDMFSAAVRQRLIKGNYKIVVPNENEMPFIEV